MRILYVIIRRALIGTCGILVVCGVIGAAYLESTLPSVEMLKDMRFQVPLRVFSSDGKLIAEFGEARRTPITLAQVPKDLINAILATEDRRFYDHAGVDLRGLMRAAVHLLTNVSMKQGGSTITMQVARNYFLTRNKTFIRKFSEILLALKIEKEFTKNEILELYLNKIYFGKRAYGIAAAAEVYYGTTVDRLTLDQIAMIAGLPQAPSSINPLHDKKAAFKRRKHVLERMLSYEFITQAQYNEAVNASLPHRYHGRTIELEAPYIAEMVRQELFNRYGEAVYTLGYEVTTTVDSRRQTAANYALRRALLEYDQRHGFRNKNRTQLKIAKNKSVQDMSDDWLEELSEIPAPGNLSPGVVMRCEGSKMIVLIQDGRIIEIPSTGYAWTKASFKVGDVVYAQPAGDQTTWRMTQVPEATAAFVALNPDTGAIQALIGGFDYANSSFNRASQAERQPGSSFKPFLYAAALTEGYTLASIFNDAPLVYIDPVTGVSWSPKNASGKFYGPTRLRVALSKSQNLVTVRVLQAIGIPTALDFIERFGFDRNKTPAVLSMALGVGTYTPLQMASAYCVFANGGSRITPHVIKKIKDYQGNMIDEPSPPAPVNAISSQVAYLITSALQDTIQKGTGQRAKILGRHDLAGKSGTTNDWLDAWFSGYNRDIVATAWVGFDEPRSLREYGGVAALPMWIYFMQEVLREVPEHSPPMPPGIVTVKIDPSSGNLTRGGEGSGIYEVFTEDTVPQENSYPSSDFIWEGSQDHRQDNNHTEYGEDSLF
jgi:penicillin-binding protein 1A